MPPSTTNSTFLLSLLIVLAFFASGTFGLWQQSVWAGIFLLCLAHTGIVLVLLVCEAALNVLRDLMPSGIRVMEEDA